MADSNFSVNTDGMVPAVDGLKSLGDRLQQITQHLESTLDGLGKPWGEDKNGESFFKQYGTSRDQTLEGVSSMADATHGVAAGIRTMINGYTSIDDKAKDAAKNLSVDSDDSGGGNYNGDNPPATDRSSVMQPRMYSGTKRMAALMPTVPGVPATGADGTPLQPREGTLLPTEPAVPATLADGTPLQPREGTLLPTEPAVPATLADGTRLQPREGVALSPTEPALLPEGQLLATVPGEPLQPREGTLLPTEQGVPAEPFQRATLREGTVLPAEVPGEPLQRATLREGTLSPAEPALLPEGRLEPTQGHSLLAREESVPATSVHESRLEPAIPAEPARFVRSEQPLQPMLTDRVAEPLQPAHLSEPLRPTVPAEPLQPLEPRLLEPVRDGVPTTPAEPLGFAELEPERYTPLEPQTPAVPEQ
ncbi:hypothetical protein [Kutzneria sp. NPDC052558]|uniref:hypothetical protein n=1 Tax=Kutzneria sp. NPDC052558 TaxID=3364121 RepID=UPI0037C92F3A